ncbi:hypothetical protein BOTU111922_26510 [Bordetella tumulicola]
MAIHSRSHRGIVVADIAFVHDVRHRQLAGGPDALVAHDTAVAVVAAIAVHRAGVEASATALHTLGTEGERARDAAQVSQCDAAASGYFDRRAAGTRRSRDDAIQLRLDVGLAKSGRAVGAINPDGSAVARAPGHRRGVAVRVISTAYDHIGRAAGYQAVSRGLGEDPDAILARGGNGITQQRHGEVVAAAGGAAAIAGPADDPLLQGRPGIKRGAIQNQAAAAAHTLRENADAPGPIGADRCIRAHRHAAAVGRARRGLVGERGVIAGGKPRRGVGAVVDANDAPPTAYGLRHDADTRDAAGGDHGRRCQIDLYRAARRLRIVTHAP